MISASRVRSQMNRVLSSTGFQHAERLRLFLAFVVERTLDGRQNELKEYTIGREVCGRPAAFDPKLDPIVRVDASRLRARLEAYYAAEGRHDPIVIELPKGAYVPLLTERAAPPAAAPVIAVLPLVSLNSAPGHEHFADSLTEDLIHALSRVPGWRVIARSSVFQFQREARDARAAGRLLNATHVVEGSVRVAAGQLRITLQLVDAATGLLLCSNKHEQPWSEVFSVQDEIVATLTDALRLEPSFTHPTRSHEAYAEYLRGRYLWHQRTPAALAESVRSYQRALTFDPSFALALAGQADSLLVSALNGPEDSAGRHCAQAEALARQALALQPDLAEALVSLGFAASIGRFAWDEGEACFARATRLAPGVAHGRYLWAVVNLAPRGQWERAFPLIAQALELDPVSPPLRRDHAMLLFLARRYAEAEAAFASLDPAFAGGLYWHARLLLECGRPADALAKLRQRERTGAANSRLRATIALAHARQGDHADARAILAELDGPLDRATVLIGLGELRAALDALQPTPALYQFGVDPLFDPLRALPGVERLSAALRLSDNP